MRKLTFLLFSTVAFLCSFYTSAQSKGKMSLEDIMNFSKNKVDVSKIPDQYAFSWKYTMQITTDKGKNFETDYFLHPNAGYYGANMKEKKKNQMFMVMDTKRKIMISTFGDGDKKNAMASNLPDYSKLANENSTKFTYKSVPGKEILGYKCKGMQAVNDKMTVTFYYTTSAKVSFAEMFQMGKNNTPDVFKGYFKSGEKPLSLEVIYTDLAKNKTTTMKCIALEKEAYTFKKADYKFM